MAQTTAALASPLELIVRSGKGLHCHRTRITTETKNSNIAQMVDFITGLPLLMSLMADMVVAIKADAEVLPGGWLSK